VPPPSTTKPDPAVGADAQSNGSLGRSLAAVADAAGQFRILADVRSERVRLRVRRLLARLQRDVLIALALAVSVLSGVVLVAIGVAGLFRVLFAERPWLGQLVAGAMLIMAGVTWAGVRRLLTERAELRRLEAKHEQLEGRRSNIEPAGKSSSTASDRGSA